MIVLAGKTGCLFGATDDIHDMVIFTARKVLHVRCMHRGLGLFSAGAQLRSRGGFAESSMSVSALLFLLAHALHTA